MLEDIKSILDNNGVVRFKMYGVEYTIESFQEGVCIYQSLNNQRKRNYKSIDDLFNNHFIYGELIKDNQRDIEILETEKEQLL